MAEYLVRADLDFSWSYHERNGQSTLRIPHNLPVSIGPFKLDDSPNKGAFLIELGLIEPRQLNQDRPDRDYPMSMLYLELKVQGSSSAEALIQADEKLENIECLLRLFQPGDVSVRRHGSVLRADKERPSLEDLVTFRPVKPRMEPLHTRPPYPLDDVVLADFGKFFSRHWCTLGTIRRRVKVALGRFNSSYERRDPSDRLIDLVIALEALFGDDGPGISYKVAMRCAGWMHSPGQDRATLFSKVREYYRLRSKAVHGEKPRSPSGDDVDALEEIVRKSLLKFLDHQKKPGYTPQRKELDDIILLGRSIP